MDHLLSVNVTLLELADSSGHWEIRDQGLNFSYGVLQFFIWQVPWAKLQKEAFTNKKRKELPCVVISLLL